VLLIKQYERNSEQFNFILNQINVIIYSYQHSMKKYLPRVFKFYQSKATCGGFLIFEWTLGLRTWQTLEIWKNKTHFKNSQFT
jgi:hypothetical protein